MTAQEPQVSSMMPQKYDPFRSHLEPPLETQAPVTPLHHDEPPLTLSETSITDAHRTITLDDLPDRQPEHPLRLTGTTPLIERLWRLALYDAEINWTTSKSGDHFAAGDNFRQYVFTRDICYSGLLGLNRIYPEKMWSSLQVSRSVRQQIGFKSDPGHIVREIDVPWEVIELSPRAFMDHYNSNSITRRTDDVVWLWCARDLLDRRQAGPGDWQWVYETGRHFFEVYYAPFFDELDGLYRGQASFIDIHFPDKKATGYPQDWSLGDCILVKSLSTNSLYVLGMQAMAVIGTKLGLTEEAAQWQRRTAALQAAIRAELGRDDGTFAYFKDKHGVLQDRREALGSALLVLSGTVTGEAAQRALAGYPVTDNGVPILHPFFPEDNWYHNNSSWSFVDTFFIKALELSDGIDRTALNAALIARTCVNDDIVGQWKFDERGKLKPQFKYDPGSFHELTDWRTKDIKGSGNQLWTAAGFIDVCARAGLLGSSR